ncbi:MAG: hypothetical protein NC293_11975 [Roseburia sp.]|nr:hypothetical protein [Roseburia sp.]
MLLLFFLLLFILLLFPAQAAEGGKNGLLLWATVLVPSLLPFSVLTSLIRTYMREKPFKYLLIAAGVLSGYPIGAKIAAELYRDGSLSYKKALFFAGATNNPSPMFVIFFVAGEQLHLAAGSYAFYLLVLLSSFLGSLAFILIFSRHIRLWHDKKKKGKNPVPNPLPASHPAPAPFPKLSFSETIDAEIAASVLLLLKIGGYIMLFSVFATLIKDFPLLPAPLRLPLCGLLEITTGNAVICQSALPHSIKKILSLAFTTFGGFSAAAQTNSVLQNTGLSIFHYIMIKLTSGIFAALLAVLFLT